MFDGFTEADFEAYAPKKWKSNVYNRERLEVKQKLLALGRAVAGNLQGTEGSPLHLEASVEHPAQWNHKQVEAQHIFFSRGPEARKHLDAIIAKGQSIASLLDDPTPQRHHVFLAVTLNHEQAEVALRLHPDARVDRENLERRLADHFEREKLVALLRRLPAGYELGLTAARRFPTVEASDALVAELLGELAAPTSPPPSPLAPAPPPRLWFVGRAFSRAATVGAGASFAAQIEAALSELIPLYLFVAWSRENDFVSIRETLAKEKQAKRQRGLTRGDEVRIVRGMFAGKSGTIQEIDARGGLKLLVGRLPVKVGADDVERR